MSLKWLPRDNRLKDHSLFGSQFWGTDAPSVIYEKRPIVHQGKTISKKLYSAWIILNNPAQYNSYTTGMVKGVIAGFQAASSDRSVVAVVFTGTGEKAFCTGGNTKEYSEYYGKRPSEYGDYMDLFNGMVDSILNCKKPVICRVNGMRIAGGQEIGMACDLSVASDLARFGQAGPAHGSAPVGGSTDFLPWLMTSEDAMYNAVSCEFWSAYKMKAKNALTDVVPVLTDGVKFYRNPLVVTDRFIDDGTIIYGESKKDEALAEAKKRIKELKIDLSMLDESVNRLIWRFANLFPECLVMSIDAIRAKKKFFWDQSKISSRHWLAANMNYEAFLGFTAFNNKKVTGADKIDFIKFREMIADGKIMNDELFGDILPKPKE